MGEAHATGSASGSAGSGSPSRGDDPAPLECVRARLVVPTSAERSADDSGPAGSATGSGVAASAMTEAEDTRDMQDMQLELAAALGLPSCFLGESVVSSATADELVDAVRFELPPHHSRVEPERLRVDGVGIGAPPREAEGAHPTHPTSAVLAPPTPCAAAGGRARAAGALAHRANVAAAAACAARDHFPLPCAPISSADPSDLGASDLGISDLSDLHACDLRAAAALDPCATDLLQLHSALSAIGIDLANDGARDAERSAPSAAAIVHHRQSSFATCAPFSASASALAAASGECSLLDSSRTCFSQFLLASSRALGVQTHARTHGDTLGVLSDGSGALIAPVGAPACAAAHARAPERSGDTLALPHPLGAQALASSAGARERERSAPCSAAASGARADATLGAAQTGAAGVWGAPSAHADAASRRGATLADGVAHVAAAGSAVEQPAVEQPMGARPLGTAAPKLAYARPPLDALTAALGDVRASGGADCADGDELLSAVPPLSLISAVINHPSLSDAHGSHHTDAAARARDLACGGVLGADRGAHCKQKTRAGEVVPNGTAVLIVASKDAGKRGTVMGTSHGFYKVQLDEDPARLVSVFRKKFLLLGADGEPIPDDSANAPAAAPAVQLPPLTVGDSVCIMEGQCQGKTGVVLGMSHGYIQVRLDDEPTKTVNAFRKKLALIAKAGAAEGGGAAGSSAESACGAPPALRLASSSGMADGDLSAAGAATTARLLVESQLLSSAQADQRMVSPSRRLSRGGEVVPTGTAVLIVATKDAGKRGTVMGTSHGFYKVQLDEDPARLVSVFRKKFLLLGADGEPIPDDSANAPAAAPAVQLPPLTVGDSVCIMEGQCQGKTGVVLGMSHGYIQVRLDDEPTKTVNAFRKKLALIGKAAGAAGSAGAGPFSAFGGGCSAGAFGGGSTSHEHAAAMPLAFGTAVRIVDGKLTPRLGTVDGVDGPCYRVRLDESGEIVLVRAKAIQLAASAADEHAEMGGHGSHDDDDRLSAMGDDDDDDVTASVLAGFSPPFIGALIGADAPAVAALPPLGGGSPFGTGVSAHLPHVASRSLMGLHLGGAPGDSFVLDAPLACDELGGARSESGGGVMDFLFVPPDADIMDFTS